MEQAAKAADEPDAADSDTTDVTDAASLASSLTVILVTSPVQSHPSTELLDRVLLSLRLLFRDHSGVCCQIVCDGVQQGSKKTKRNTALSEERIQAYIGYKQTLISRFGHTCKRCGCGCLCGVRAKHWSQHTPLGALDFSVSELEGWHGFGWALRYALTLVRTPQVLVLPHDMEFSQSVHLHDVLDLGELCAILADETNSVEYIGLANPSILNYAERVRAKSGICLKPQHFTSARHASARRQPTLLLPLFRWKENPHVANVRQYANVVFGATAWPKVKRGQFLEETIGQRQNGLILAAGSGKDGGDWREEHAKWGTFLFWPAPAAATDGCGNGVPHSNSGLASPPTFAITHHLDGHVYRSVAERLAVGHLPHAFELERSEAAARIFVDGQASLQVQASLQRDEMANVGTERAHAPM